jgi:hypothetical protein
MVPAKASLLSFCFFMPSSIDFTYSSKLFPVLSAINCKVLSETTALNPSIEEEIA